MLLVQAHTPRSKSVVKHHLWTIPGGGIIIHVYVCIMTGGIIIMQFNANVSGEEERKVNLTRSRPSRLDLAAARVGPLVKFLSLASRTTTSTQLITFTITCHGLIK